VSNPCVTIELELSAFLDGELAVEEHARVARHLEQCSRCEAETRRLRGVSGVLRRWDAQETRYAQSHAFRSRVLRRLGAEETAPAALAPTFSWGHLAAAAAVVAAVALGAGQVAGLGASGTRTDDRLDVLELAFAEHQGSATANRGGSEGFALPEIDRTEWDQVVRSRGPGVVPDAPVESLPEVAWENRGEHVIARSAAVDYERFETDRRFLQRDEKIREAGDPPERDGTTAGAGAVPPVASFLASARLAEGHLSAYKQVQVWPILADGIDTGSEAGDVGPGPLTAQEALRSRLLEARNGSVAGTVELRTRDLPRPVLILAGDVLSGGVQDRVAGEDVLLGPDTTLTISLLASGRARKRSVLRRLNSSPGMAPAGPRADLVAQVGQARFDEMVSHTVAVLGSPGPEGLRNLFGNSELLKEADSYARKFDSRLDRPGVIGFAVAAGSKLLGVEVFGDTATFRAMRSRVLRSYVLEALTLTTEDIMGSPPAREEVAGMLAAAGRGVVLGSRSAGVGTIRDIAAAGTGANGFIGFGLSRGAEVVHAVIFPGRSSGRASGSASRGSAANREGGGSGGPDIGPGGVAGPERGTPGSPRGGPKPENR